MTQDEKDDDMENEDTNCMPPTAPATGSELRVETWECRACRKEAPCTVSITYEPTGYKDIDNATHFRRRSCVCGGPVVTDWKHIQNTKVCDLPTTNPKS